MRKENKYMGDRNLYLRFLPKSGGTFGEAAFPLCLLSPSGNLCLFVCLSVCISLFLRLPVCLSCPFSLSFPFPLLSPFPLPLSPFLPPPPFVPLRGDLRRRKSHRAVVLSIIGSFALLRFYPFLFAFPSSFA